MGAKTALVGGGHGVGVHRACFPCLVNVLVTLDGLDDGLSRSFFGDGHLVVAAIAEAFGGPLNGDGA